MPSRMAQAQAMSFDTAWALSNTPRPPSAAVRRFINFLLLLDLLQTLRVVCSEAYGWNKQIVNFWQSLDIVFAVTDVVSRLIPRYWLLCLTGTVISSTIGGLALFSRKLLATRQHSDRVVGALRLAIKAQISFFFVSLFQWSLMAFDCVVYPEDRFSISKQLHGSEEPCRPWQSPELIVTGSGLLLATVLVVFSKFCLTFLVETNPMSRRPMAMWTSEVEERWLMTRAAFVVCLYLSAHISEVGSAVISALLALSILRMHIRVMPFQDRQTNYMRGGVYAAVTVTCSCSALIAIVGEEAKNPTFQWVLVVLAPVGFLVGLAFVRERQKGLTKALNRLKGEWEAQESNFRAIADARSSSPTQKPNDRMSAKDDKSSVGFNAARTTSVGSIRKATAQNGGPQATSRTLFDKFFDSSWESKRAFTSDTEAVIMCRELLNKRSENDLEFLDYLITRGIEEYPTSAGILLFKISVLHFVIQDPIRAAQWEKEARKKNDSFRLTQKYVLFAIGRSTDEAMVNHAWGAQGMTVSKLVELDASVDRARKAHLQCLNKLKSFWKHVRKAHRAGNKFQKQMAETDDADSRAGSFKSAMNVREEVGAKQLLSDLASLDSYVAVAEQEYAGLLEKYPESLPVLQSCASFYDVVVNDFQAATDLNERVSRIYNQREAAVSGYAKEGGPQMEGKEDDRGSTASGMTTTRSIITKHMQNLKHTFLISEETSLRRIKRTVHLGLLIALAMVLGLFMFTDRYLFSTRAMINILRMEASAKLRHMAVSGTFFLRSQFLATMGHHNETEWMEAKAKTKALADHMRIEHREAYEVSGNGMKDYLTRKTESTVFPTRGVWQTTDISYWNLLNEFIRRMELATTATQEQLEDPNFDLLESSIEKSNIAYCQENLFRSIVPAVDHTVEVYQKEVFHFGNLKNIIVTVSCLLEGIVIGGLSIYILWWNQKLVSRLQHHAACSIAAMAVAEKYSRRFLHFYSDHEVNLMILQDEDENMEREHALEQEVNHEFENQDADTVPSSSSKRETYSAHQMDTAMLTEIPPSWSTPPRSDKDSIILSVKRDADAGLEGPGNKEKQQGVESVSPEFLNDVRSRVRDRLSWFQRWQVIAFFLTILLALSALSVAYPSAEIPHLVNLAPIANQASRRKLLVVAIAHFVRELVLDDGFSRLSKAELSGAIRHSLDQLMRADQAIRLGNDLRIKSGVDGHSPEHMELMYSVNCLWTNWNEGEAGAHRRSDGKSSQGLNPRAQQRAKALQQHGLGWHRRAGSSSSSSASYSFDASTCSNSSRQDAVQNGLYYLLLSFYDAAENILVRYGVDESLQDTQAYLTPREGIEVAQMYTTVEVDPEKDKLLVTDPDVVFVLEAIEGDLFNGMGLAMEDVNLEMPRILGTAHNKLEITFSVVVVWIVVYYLFIFRPAMNFAFSELQLSRKFLVRMPLQQFPIKEVDQIVSKIALSSQQLYDAPVIEKWPFRKSEAAEKEPD